MATAAQATVSASLYLSARDVGVRAVNSTHAYAVPRIPFSNVARTAASFTCGSPLLIWRTTSERKPETKATAVSIRCEQGAKQGSGLDVWLGRFAMVGFAAAIGVEITTGKGVLENFGLTSPLPTVALAVTALVGVLTAIFIFQSASKE